MFVRVVVLDPLPMFRHGVVSALHAAGRGDESPDDVFEWLAEDSRRLVLLTLQTASDWELLGRLRREHEDVPVIALLPHDSLSMQVRALSSGAAAVLPRDTGPLELVTAVASLMDGRAQIPLAALRAVTSAESAAQDDSPISPQELDWLSQLSLGMTVAGVAERAGYSERMMFRLLRDMYARLEVPGRTEALLLARERGWL
jgi:DNA-binding NarL/FixJ family response regulator